MAQISFTGLCSGTSEKVSKSKGTKYKVTTFVELPSLKTFDVFGDLGLSAHQDPRPYVLEANIQNIGDVVVKEGASSSPKKS